MKSLSRKQEAQKMGFDDIGNFFKKQPLNVTDNTVSPLSRMTEEMREAFENFMPKTMNKGEELANS